MKVNHEFQCSGVLLLCEFNVTHFCTELGIFLATIYYYTILKGKFNQFSLSGVFPGLLAPFVVLQEVHFRKDNGANVQYVWFTVNLSFK